MQISIQEQIKCVEREIAMRQRVYPRLVINGKMTAGEKDKQIAAMHAVYNTLILAERVHLHRSCNQLPDISAATLAAEAAKSCETIFSEIKKLRKALLDIACPPQIPLQPAYFIDKAKIALGLEENKGAAS